MEDPHWRSEAQLKDIRSFKTAACKMLDRQDRLVSPCLCLETETGSAAWVGALTDQLFVLARCATILHWRGSTCGSRHSSLSSSQSMSPLVTAWPFLREHCSCPLSVPSMNGSQLVMVLLCRLWGPRA